MTYSVDVDVGSVFTEKILEREDDVVVVPVN